MDSTVFPEQMAANPADMGPESWTKRVSYPLVNIQKTMENHHSKWVNPL